MSERLRIAFLTPEYPTVTGTGGIAAYVQEMAFSLLDLGHEPHVIIQTHQEYEFRSHDGPIPLHRVRHPKYSSFLPFPMVRGSSLWSAHHIASLVRELGIDVLEAPEYCGLSGFLSLFKPRRMALVVRVHLCEAITWSFNHYEARSLRERFGFRVRNWLETRAIETADALTCTSQATAATTRDTLQIRRNDFNVIPNPGGRVFFQQQNRPLESVTTVTAVGRLEWRKGQDVLVSAIPAILERVPGARFVLAGDDTPTAPGNQSVYEYLLGRLSEHERSTVTYLGYVDPSVVAELYRDAVVCVFPARWEGLPIAVIEAMASGCGIVVSDAAPMKELIRHNETGLVAESENPASLAECIIRLLEDPQLRRKLGMAARTEAIARLSGKEVAKQTLAVYESAIQRLKCRAVQ